VKKRIYGVLKKWPDYQAISDLTLNFLLKQRLKLLILYLAAYLNITKIQKNNLKVTKNLKNTKKNKPIVLFATGPGADKTMNLFAKNKKYSDLYEIAVVNWFYKSIFAKEIKPNYYFISDPVFFSSNNDGLRDYLTQNEKTILTIPFTSKIDGLKNNINYINTLTYFKKRKNINPLKANLFPSSVVIHAITYLNYLGYYPIYVSGLDVSYNRSFMVNEINELILKKNELYGKHIKDHDFERPINLSNREITPRNMSEVLINDAIMLNDLKKLSSLGVVNIGGDFTNDSFPRASLFLKT
jgi:hypothetical protein